MRTSRTDGTTTYEYVYDDTQLSAMSKGDDTLVFAYDATGRPLSVTWNGTVYYYSTNLQGDIIAILDGSGNTVVIYEYDAWGYLNMVHSPYGSNLASTLGVLNPLLYRGYVYDHETCLYYLQSRYYDPYVGRFINADGLISTDQGFLGNNMFAYCLNSPINRIDSFGKTSEEETTDMIEEYLEEIILAGEKYGVDPVAIIACIYIEQRVNVNWVDHLTDVPLYMLDTSVGMGQVKISTAKMLEDCGYIEKTPFFWKGIMGRKRAIAKKLTDPAINIEYVAAYLKYWQDFWGETIDISGKIEILVTLYNLGKKANPPNKNPQPGDFGIYYLENEVKIRALYKK